MRRGSNIIVGSGSAGLSPADVGTVRSSQREEEVEVEQRPTSILPKVNGRQMASSTVPSLSARMLPHVVTFTGTYTPVNPDSSVVSTSTPGFSPRVYLWSTKSTQSPPDVGHQVDSWQPLGNGGSGVSGRGDVADPVSLREGVANTSSSPKTRSRSSDNITHRWTQRLKEKWRGKQESLGKKRKEDRVKEKRNDTKPIEFLAEYKPPVREDKVTKMSNEEDMTIQLPIRQGPVEAPPTLPENNSTEGHFREGGHS
ncbi:hypothetical protein DPEC_G00375980 [Dallia pectoralis]|nr:hypothetical protein DPEC_G00375980 [Dallia pectoralis]